MSGERCETCRFFDKQPALSKCRRYAPRASSYALYWPGVEKSDWCGEHSPPPS